MTFAARAAALCLLLACSVRGFAAEAWRPGAVSVRGSAGAATAVASDDFRHRSGMGASVGGAMLVRATPWLSLFGAYDHPQVGRWLQSESVTAGFRLSMAMPAGWTPFLETGAGLGRTDSNQLMRRVAVKADVGVEKMVGPRVSLGFLVGYHRIGSGRFSLQELAPSAFAAYHFGK